MIFGNYPCCDGELTLSMPDQTPTFAKENCPHCGELVWHKFSRIEPQSFTEAQFLDEYEVDDESMSITRKCSKHISPDLREFMNRAADAAAKGIVADFEDRVINGPIHGGPSYGILGKPEHVPQPAALPPVLTRQLRRQAERILAKAKGE